MSIEKANRIRLIYGIITALLIAVCAVFLIICCIGIRQAGERPFTRENVTAALQQLALPGWLCLVAIAGGFVLNAALPSQQRKVKPLRNGAEILAGLQVKRGDLTDDAALSADKERTFRRITQVLTVVLCLICAAYPVIYYADASHFTVTELGADVVRALLAAMIPTAAALTFFYLCRRLCDASITREIALYRTNGVKAERIKVKRRNLSVLRWVLPAVAVLLIVLGIFNGGHKDVLDKAIKICTECIGLG